MKSMERRPHILAVPNPGQGHVLPLMELSQCLAKRGFKVTFVNTDHYHHKILKSKDYVGDGITLVSIPGGLEPSEDRNKFGKVAESLNDVAPRKLVELIHKINESENDKISCIIADQILGWAFKVGAELNIQRAAFWSASAAILAQSFHVDKFIQDGIIDENGNPLKNQVIRLAPAMPAMHTTNLLWLAVSDDEFTKRFVFETIKKNNEIAKSIDRIVCNSAYDLEPGAFTLAPNIVPIGPLLASSREGNTAGCFWKEDATCLQWLAQQPLSSVVYVAFGSITTLDQNQFHELALGLELTGRPFLWVVRPGITNDANVYPEGFEERVTNRGKVVQWAPQQQVLSHPAVGCFVSHCGWNSTMEGVANGVPFLCWPYFADQFLNETYISDVWKVGLSFERDDSGIIRREEIKSKVELVLSDGNVKDRARELKEIAMKSVGECGRSSENFNDFVKWLSLTV